MALFKLIISILEKIRGCVLASVVARSRKEYSSKIGNVELNLLSL